MSPEKLEYGTWVDHYLTPLQAIEHVLKIMEANDVKLGHALEFKYLYRPAVPNDYDVLVQRAFTAVKVIYESD